MHTLAASTLLASAVMEKNPPPLPYIMYAATQERGWMQESRQPYTNIRPIYPQPEKVLKKL